MKKLVVTTIVLLNVAGLGGVAYATDYSTPTLLNNQTIIDPSKSDQAKGSDAQAQDDKSSPDDAIAKQDS